MKRGLLAIALGIAFLILMIWIGTLLDSIVPHGVTAQVQTAQAGPYHVTFQVKPNPPLTTQATTLSIQVLVNASQQPVTNAHVTLTSNMQTMDMGIDQVEAQSQENGMYHATVQFPMSGSWRVQVVISLPEGTKSVSAVFEVTAQ
jgi:archaellum component FlaG (FlaF/FlaG flagellin family)